MKHTTIQALSVAMATPSLRGHRGIPVLLWGNPGVGKTAVVEAIAKAWGRQCLTLIASLHDPTDFVGLPVSRNGHTEFVPPEWFVTLDDQTVLFLDELTTAPPAVQAAALRLVNERRLGMRPMPDEVAILAAANPPEIGGNELSLALANRFVHLNCHADLDGYTNGILYGWDTPPIPKIPDPDEFDAAKRVWAPIVARFLKTAPNLLETKPGDGEFAFASPRTWHFLLHLAATCHINELATPGKPASDVFTLLAVGCVGSGAALPFLHFVKNLNMPTIDEVLNGTWKFEPLSDDALFVVINGVFDAIGKHPEAAERFMQMALFYKHQKDICVAPAAAAMNNKHGTISAETFSEAISQVHKRNPALGRAVEKEYYEITKILGDATSGALKNA